VANDAGVLIERSGENLLGVRSDLTFTSVTAVLAQSQSLLHEGSSGVVIDLADVTRADSAGLALLMQWLRIGKKLGKDIRFRHLPDQLLAIARASDLESLIPLEG
jgi:phospholipid transport system transporter-binding protein